MPPGAAGQNEPAPKPSPRGQAKGCFGSALGARCTRMLCCIPKSGGVAAAVRVTARARATGSTPQSRPCRRRAGGAPWCPPWRSLIRQAGSAASVPGPAHAYARYVPCLSTSCEPVSCSSSSRVQLPAPLQAAHRLTGSPMRWSANGSSIQSQVCLHRLSAFDRHHLHILRRCASVSGHFQGPFACICSEGLASRPFGRLRSTPLRQPAAVVPR